MRRRSLALLPLALALVAFAEVAVFVAVAHALGGGWALLLLAGASLCGMLLLKREGVRGWRAFRAATQQGRAPGREVSHSLTGLAGALLLAVPGFLTAIAGLLLLVPPGRTLGRRAIERFAERRLGAGVAGDLFGPRRVRVHPGDPVVVVQRTGDPVRTPAGAIEGEVVEGDVLH
jgi:UPF0716 protein FxsA